MSFVGFSVTILCLNHINRGLKWQLITDWLCSSTLYSQGRLLFSDRPYPSWPWPSCLSCPHLPRLPPVCIHLSLSAVKERETKLASDKKTEKAWGKKALELPILRSGKLCQLSCSNILWNSCKLLLTQVRSLSSGVHKLPKAVKKDVV